MDHRNLTLLTDLYELTMMQGYFKEKDANETVIFDMFYRTNPHGNGFAICAGLEQAIEYIKGLHFDESDIEYLRSLNMFEEDFLEYLSTFRFTGDIYAIPEGTVVFPRESLIKVIAPIMQAQLVETALLTIINHQSLIATKTERIVHAAKGDGVMEFGLRRAQGPDAGTYGARAAMIAGCIGTSNVLCGKMFDVPVKGTHAHSWIMSFPDELTAFRTYAKLYPSACILLVDTYDTLKSGIPNAIKVTLPQAKKQTAAKPLTRVTIDANLNYYVAFGNQRETQVTFDEITPFLQDSYAKEPEMFVALYADETVPYKEIVKILNIANENKFKMVLATRAQK